MAMKPSWVLSSAALLLLLAALPALADDPALIGLSIGRYDQDWIEPDFLFLEAGHGGEDGAVDFRLEYRFGTSLISWTEPYVKIKPFIGLEGTSDQAIYGLGGILFDIPLGPVMLTRASARDCTAGVTAGILDRSWNSAVSWKWATGSRTR